MLRYAEESAGELRAVSGLWLVGFLRLGLWLFSCIPGVYSLVYVLVGDAVR